LEIKVKCACAARIHSTKAARRDAQDGVAGLNGFAVEHARFFDTPKIPLSNTN